MLRSIGASLVVALAFAVLPSQAAEPQQAIVRACAADVDRLCAGVPPGEGRIKACMKAHVSEPVGTLLRRDHGCRGCRQGIAAPPIGWAPPARPPPPAGGAPANR